MIIESDGSRTELKYISERHGENIIFSERTYTTPVHGTRTMWSRGIFGEKKILTIPRNQIPALIMAMAQSLIEDGESV